MVNHVRLMSLGIVAFLSMACFSPAFGQQNTLPSQTAPAGSFAHENVRGVRGRAPGDLVSAGVARAIQANISGQRSFEITEPKSDKLSFWAEFLTRAIPIVFEQVDQAIALFENLLLARAGAPPSLPGGDLSGLDLGNLAGGTGG